MSGCSDWDVAPNERQLDLSRVLNICKVETKEDLDKLSVLITREQTNRQSVQNDYGYEDRKQLLTRYSASEVEVLTRLAPDASEHRIT